MSYCKVNWIKRDVRDADGGKYYSAENGFFFAPEDHKIFKMMQNIYDYLSEIKYKIDNKYYDKSALELLQAALKTALYTQISMTENEYNSCIRLFGAEMYMVTGSYNRGGPKPETWTLEQLEESILEWYNDQAEEENLLSYDQIKTISKINF